MSTVAAPASRDARQAIAGLIDEALLLLGDDPAEARARLQQALRIAAPGAPPVAPGGLAVWQRRAVLAFVAENIDRAIPIEAAAATVRLSASHFSRAFRNTFGLTFSRYVLERRIDRAKTLLAESAEPIAQVALACGTADQSHFTRLFGREVGVTPLNYRRIHGDPTRRGGPRQERANRGCPMK